MKKVMNVFAVMIALGLSGFIMASACEDAAELAEDVCGPCGKVENGDATITGNAELDGIFKAVGTLKMSTGSIKADFDGQVRAMAEGVFGIEGVAEMDTDTVVKAIVAQFDTQITAYIEGGLKVAYEPPRCEADVNVAVSAQAQCEAKVDASCSAEVSCTPGEASFKCEGKCEGSCSAECTVPSCTIQIEPAGIECEGECSGSCTFNASAEASCEGKCEGTCDGECSAYNADGSCSGSCSGKCNGECTVEGALAADCSGTCRGECKITEGVAEAECEGSFGCAGECQGECSGSCEGSITAPKCEGQAECSADVEAKCEAQASAQASASLKCSPPSLEIGFAFKSGVNADNEADVRAKLNRFKTSMTGIIQGWARLKALVETDASADVTIEPPVVTIKASAEAFLTKLRAGEIEFEAPGLALCAIPAFNDSVDILGSIRGDVQGTISSQAKLVALLDI